MSYYGLSVSFLIRWRIFVSYQQMCQGSYFCHLANFCLVKKSSRHSHTESIFGPYNIDLQLSTGNLISRSGVMTLCSWPTLKLFFGFHGKCVDKHIWFGLLQESIRKFNQLLEEICDHYREDRSTHNLRTKNSAIYYCTWVWTNVMEKYAPIITYPIKQPHPLSMLPRIISLFWSAFWI